MRICVPTATKDGAKAKIYGHFGSAPYFTLCDIQTMKYEIIDNGNLVHEHGMCNPLKAVGSAKPDAVVVGGIGMGAIRGLNAAGIKVYNPAKTVADCFKFRSKIGTELAIHALRECFREKKASMDELWEAAKICRVANVMRPYMESLS